MAEDAVASRLLLRALAHAAGVPVAADFDIGLHYGGDGELQVRCTAALDSVAPRCDAEAAKLGQLQL